MASEQYFEGQCWIDGMRLEDEIHSYPYPDLFSVINLKSAGICGAVHGKYELNSSKKPGSINYLSLEINNFESQTFY